MNQIRSFRELLVWQKAMVLVENVYRAVHLMPRHEQFVLGEQLRRSGISIPSNVAEGFSRNSSPAYVNHVWIAHGSAAELETQLEIGRRVGVIASATIDLLVRDVQEVSRMLNGLAKSLELRARRKAEEAKGHENRQKRKAVP